MDKIIQIQNTSQTFGSDEIFIIAEIGKNFIQTEDERSVSEYLHNAKELVLAARDAGVNAVKFQTHEVEDEVLNLNFTSPHFKAKDRYSWVTRNMIATPFEEFWKPLKAYCDELDILFHSTPMSRKAAIKLEGLSVPIWKIGSGDVQDYVTLNYLIRTGKPIIISTGMVSLAELDEVITYITKAGSPLVVLYCISKYPCPPELFNLGTIEYLIEKYPDVVIGFSDHSLTHDASLRAMKLGAKVIEKHFSFSRDFWGADHKVSLMPSEMKELVQNARSGTYRDIEIGTFYGTRDQELEGASNQFRPFFNKGLMAGQDIPAHTVLTEEMVYAMRPISLSGGLPSNKLNEVVGKRVGKDLKKFEPLSKELFLGN